MTFVRLQTDEISSFILTNGVTERQSSSTVINVATCYRKCARLKFRGSFPESVWPKTDFWVVLLVRTVIIAFPPCSRDMTTLIMWRSCNNVMTCMKEESSDEILCRSTSYWWRLPPRYWTAGLSRSHSRQRFPPTPVLEQWWVLTHRAAGIMHVLV